MIKPYYESSLGKLYHGSCEDIMPELEQVDLTVTSPPYGKLRDYHGYTFNFKAIANQLYRITKDGGVIVWVVGDETINGSESGESFRQALYFKEIGFNLHDTMIYQKHNFSNPSNTRYHQIFEFVFVLSKKCPKTFNPIKDRKNIEADKIGSWGKNTVRQKNGSFKINKKKVNSGHGMRYNIWRIKTEMNPLHPAQFPEALAQDHIISWSNPNDIILDPMAGSGTVPKMCERLNRRWVACESSEEYCELSAKRIETEASQLKLFR